MPPISGKITYPSKKTGTPGQYSISIGSEPLMILKKVYPDGIQSKSRRDYNGIFWASQPAIEALRCKQWRIFS